MTHHFTKCFFAIAVAVCGTALTTSFPSVCAAQPNIPGFVPPKSSSGVAPLHPAARRNDYSRSLKMNPANDLFQPVATYIFPTVPAPVSTAASDLNGDGKLDLVVISPCSNPGNCHPDGFVSVLIGNGDGTFSSGASYDSGGPDTAAVAVADVNQDGKPDIVLINNGQQPPFQPLASVGIMFGNGDGTFQPVMTYDFPGDWLGPMALADVNGDGKQDVVITGCITADGGCGGTLGFVGIMLGNGDGTLQSATLYYPGTSEVTTVSIADLDGDGKQDLVVTNSPAGVSVLMGNGDGTFKAPANYSSGYGVPGAVAADVNGDGKPDVIVVNCTSAACSEGGVGVLLGNGDGTLQPVKTFDAGGFNTEAVAVADIDGDGKADLIVANCSVATDTCGTGTPGWVGVLLGNGDGTFQPAINYSSGGGWVFSLVVADLNGDRKPDVVAGNYWPGSLGVLLNSSGKPGKATSTGLSSSLNPAVFGQAITFTAKVKSAAGVPTGTVTFVDGANTLGSVALANAQASLTVSTLSAGRHSIAAAYSGSNTLAHSRSAPRNQNVKPAKTTTTLLSSANPVAFRSRVSYGVTVTGEFGGAVTGEIACSDSGVTFLEPTLSGNQAACEISYKAAAIGIHSITAAYPGDGNNNSSSSSLLREGVGPAPFHTETSVTTSGSPSMGGQSVTFAAPVSSKYGAIPDGELVTFYNGSTVIGTSATAGSQAVFTTSSLTAGAHLIRAVYGGEALLKPSRGWVEQTVEK